MPGVEKKKMTPKFPPVVTVTQLEHKYVAYNRRQVNTRRAIKG
jgi:hypothetical protein